MPCIPTILGFDIDSPQEACIKFRSNPQTYYLSCNINDTPGINTPCTAYTNSTCSVELPQSGYFAYEFGFRYYSKSGGDKYTIAPLDTCDTSTKVRKCCGGDEIYNATNLNTILGYSAAVGMVIDMNVTDSNSKQFRTCFEVVDSSLVSSSNIVCNSINELYDYNQCSVCINNLINDGTNCYLSQGNYTFENCDNGETITLTIPTSNVYKVNDVVFFNGKCYFATLITPTKPVTGTTGPVLVNGCNNVICKPIIPPITPKSFYVSGCCDNKIYRLQSETKYDVGTTISIGPSNFCYRVIAPPSTQPPVLVDNFIKTITTGCNDPKCQPCSSNSIANVLNVRPIENQCGIITKSPLKLECATVNPTLSNPNGGILSVNIVGGTPQYTVVWYSSGGQSFTGKTITNKPAGTYICNVRDKWGDYNATISCTLTQPINCNYEGLLSEVSALSCDDSGGLQAYAYSSQVGCIDIEQYLKYAEAVGLTQSVAVP